VAEAAERAIAVERSLHIEELCTGGEKRSEPRRRRRAWARLLYVGAWVGWVLIRVVRWEMAVVRVVGEGEG